jgi:hypothetical protein
MKKAKKDFWSNGKVFGHSDNTWEAKRNFNSMKPINEYMEKVREYNNFGVKSLDTNNNTKRTRKRNNALLNF